MYIKKCVTAIIFTTQHHAEFQFFQLLGK